MQPLDSLHRFKMIMGDIVEDKKAPISMHERQGHLQVLGGDEWTRHVDGRGCQGGVRMDPAPPLICCSPCSSIPLYLK